MHNVKKTMLIIVLDFAMIIQGYHSVALMNKMKCA